VVEKKKRKGCLIPSLIIAVIFTGALIFGITQIIQNPEKYQNKSTLAKTLDLNSDQEAAILEVFEKCGIGEIKKVELFQEGEEHSSYNITDNEISGIVVWISNKKEIESIYFRDNDIFVNGEMISPVTAYYVNSIDKDRYRTASQEAIKQVLNYPDTAKFQGITKWKFGIEEGIIIVQSSVTAKNAFGVEDTLDFQVKFENSIVISLILDGIEYIQ